jgi:mono/diheme cytochrome c family protein
VEKAKNAASNADMNRKSMTKLSLSSLAVIVALLSGCSKPSGPAVNPASPYPSASAPHFDPANGKAVFTRVCAVCHQPTGVGVPGAFPPLAGSEIAATKDPTIPIKIVLFGLQGPITVSGKAFNSVMPPQGAILSDKDIADALSYARISWGNNAPSVSEAAVSSIRGSITRTTMWTWAELKQP